MNFSREWEIRIVLHSPTFAHLKKVSFEPSLVSVLQTTFLFEQFVYLDEKRILLTFAPRHSPMVRLGIGSRRRGGIAAARIRRQRLSYFFAALVTLFCRNDAASGAAEIREALNSNTF